jgi:hypothetical protein
MSADFHCIVTDPARVESYQRLFSRDWVAVKSPVPEWAELPGIGLDLVYLMDLDELTPQELDNLCRDIAQRFELPLEEVEENIRVEGCPVRFNDTYMAVHNPHKWLS